MPEKNLNSQIKEMLVASLMLKLPASEIGDDTLLFSPDGLALDSIDALELVLGVEKEFGIKVQDEEVGVKAFASVDALCEFIRSKAA